MKLITVFCLGLFSVACVAQADTFTRALTPPFYTDVQRLDDGTPYFSTTTSGRHSCSSASRVVCLQISICSTELILRRRFPVARRVFSVARLRSRVTQFFRVRTILYRFKPT